MANKQISVPVHVWSYLVSRKIHPRETHGDVICRLLGLSVEQADRLAMEQVQDTSDMLSDDLGSESVME